MKKILIIAILILGVYTLMPTVKTLATTAPPECVDGVDNDGDGKIDVDDPECHLDADASNISSYDPTVEKENNTTGTCTNCGGNGSGTGGGGSGGSGGGRGSGHSRACANGLDDDSDGLVDQKDPGCHRDGDASNDASYNRGDDDESNPAPIVTPPPAPVPQVLGQATTRPVVLQRTAAPVGANPLRLALNANAVAIAKAQNNALVIEKLGINKPIVQLHDISALRSEAWILPWTSTPEKGGNTVIVGHSYNSVGGVKSENTFFNLDKLAVGDSIEVEWKGKKYVYVVAEKGTATPNQVELENPSGSPMLTIYACGQYDNTYRNYVKAVLQPEPVSTVTA